MAASEEKQRPSSLYMDLKELRVRFSEVDIHNKGYIEYEGLQQMISNMEGFDSSASSELMAALDRDGDGKVSLLAYFLPVCIWTNVCHEIFVGNI